MPGIYDRKMFKMADGGPADAILGNTAINPANVVNSPIPGEETGTDPVVQSFIETFGRLPTTPEELAQFVNPNVAGMADGGMVPPMGEDMAFMEPQQEAQIYQEAQNLPPEVLQAAGGEIDALTEELLANNVESAVTEETTRSINNMETAGDFKDIMNSVWDQDEGIESYRARLAEVVGPEDAQRTPDSVLALVQPTLQLAQIDQGIGALMQEELSEVGGMSGGITELATKSAVADGMAAETGALVNAVGGMAQGPSGMVDPNQQAMGMDPMMMQAMMQGAGPMGQGMV